MLKTTKLTIRSESEENVLYYYNYIYLIFELYFTFYYYILLFIIIYYLLLSYITYKLLLLKIKIQYLE